MKCPNCGKEVADNTTRCYFCDYVIVEEVIVEEPAIDPEVIREGEQFNGEPSVTTKALKRKFHWGSFFFGLGAGLLMSGFSFFLLTLFFGRREFLIGAIIGIFLEIVVMVIIMIIRPDLFALASLFMG